MSDKTGDKKGLGKTVLGWFVVQEGDDKPQDTDALIQKYANEAPATMPVELKGPLPSVINGQVAFPQVYDAAGIDSEEQSRVTKAQELLRSLPAETPAPVKKQIVEAALKAFGVSTDKIIEAAVGEIEALEAFIRVGQGDTQKVLTEGNSRIIELEKEIAEIKAAMQQAVTDQEARGKTANGEKLKIQEVLEFFGTDVVAKVVNDSPKLHAPNS